MRSVDSPRVLHDATVELESGTRARSVNLSTSGIFVSSEEKHQPGERVQLKVNLRDGANPLEVGAEVVRAGNDGLALRFVNLDDMAKQRIQRLVQKREPTGLGKRDVRIHLPSLASPLRAMARDLNDTGVMIEAELPWLRLGSPVTAELSPERACDGHVSWIGLDVTRKGAARLRIFVDFSGDENAMTPPPPDLLQASTSNVMPSPVMLPSITRRHLVWPAIAITALIAVGALATAMTLRPPKPSLLPTHPPEQEAIIAKLPPRVVVPKESDAIAAPATGEPPTATTTATPTATVMAMPFGPPRLIPLPATTTPTTSAATTTASAASTPATGSGSATASRGKVTHRKHARAKRRAD